MMWWLNIFLGILMLIAGLAGLVSPSTISFVALLGLIYPLLLLLQVLFLIFWILLLNVRLLFPMLILFISFTGLKQNIGFHCEKTRNSTNTLNLLSYNVQSFSQGKIYRKDKAIEPDVLQFVMQRKPDILCMQEYRTSGRRPDILRHFSRHGTYYFRNYLDDNSKKGVGILIASPYPSKDKGVLKFTKGRIFAIYSDFVIEGRRFRLINVHLESIGLNAHDMDLLVSPVLENAAENNFLSHWHKIYSKLSHALRLHEKQINKITGFINHSPWPVILCGDFNDTPASYTYHQTAKLLHDSFLDKACLMKSTYAGPLPFLRIDHVFIPKQFETISYQRYKVHFSDHFPIQVELRIK